MKMSTSLVILTLTAFALTAAQAQMPRSFIFSNRGSSLGTRAPIYDAVGNRLAGTAYLAQLYVGADQNSLQPLSPVKSFLTDGLAGYFSPSVIIADNVGIRTEPYIYQIRAWDASLGATYAEALAQGRGGVGESNFAMEYAGIALPGATLEPAPVVGLQSFSLSPLRVPEPYTYALLVLGAGALWWQCRCRSNS